MQMEGCAFDRVLLLDVQGLFGGRELWLAADGSAHARVVGPPAPGQAMLGERRFTFTVGPGELAELARLLARHDLTKMRTPNRYGVPDEARPVVCVQAGRKIHAVGKWANDAHAEFDAIYLFLTRLVNREAQAAAGEGKWDGEVPPGFPDRQTAQALSQPR